MIEFMVYEDSKLGQRLAVRNAPYTYKDILKYLPGAFWNPDIKAWHYPPTADSLLKLAALFPEAHYDQSMDHLKSVAMALQLAQQSKHAVGLPQPETRKTEAWGHQLQAYWFAYHRLRCQGGVMLALDMGTGKSKVTIDLLSNLAPNGKILIMCPTSVLAVWQSEWERHAPNGSILVLPRVNIEKRTKLASDFLEVNNCGPRVVVINHEGVWREPFKGWVLGQKWDFGVVDESHRSKTPGGVFSRFLKTLRSRCQYRLALTGTPAPHSPLDLYAQFRWTDPSIYGESNAVHRARYAVLKKMGNYDIVLGFKNQEEMNEKFHSGAIQIKAKDCLDLPESQHIIRTCELSPHERKVYDDMKSEMVVLVREGAITAKNALAKIMRLAQITQGVVRTEDGKEVEIGDSKHQLLRDVLEDIDEPVVVFCRFKSDLARIDSTASDMGRPAFELSGECNELEEWKESCSKGEPSILAVQLQAGGVGISMVQARYCIYLSVDFNLGNYDQSAARVLRPGQERNVTYVHLVAEDTIDQTIYNALSKRKNIVESILDEMKG